MTEIKTLNDIPSIDLSDEIPSETERFIPESILKAEAVKWVKEDIETFKEFYKDIPIFVKKWMERFNLTEEDLK
jgi:hypothetical protein